MQKLDLKKTFKALCQPSAKAVAQVVVPLEGLWWADDMEAFRRTDPSKWKTIVRQAMA